VSESDLWSRRDSNPRPEKATIESSTCLSTFRLSGYLR